MRTPKNEIVKSVDRKVWNKPQVKVVGTVGKVLRQGGGKLSATTGDPGEPRKVPATG